MRNSLKLIMIGILSILLLQGCVPESIQRKYLEKQTQLTQEAINKSASLQELDKVCTAVKLPASFVFVYKGGLDDQKLSLTYNYYSDIPFSEALPIIKKYFAENGWSEEDLSHRYPQQLDFTSKEYRIAFYHGGMNLSNYAIYCEKLKQ